MKTKRLPFILLLFSCYLNSYGQITELTYNFQQINFSAAPRTALNPMSIKLWDSYNNGGPTTYGTVLEIYGRSGHQTSQLNFGGWDNSRIRYREAFYSQNTWSDWLTLLDSKNDVESQGNLKINGGGNHFILNGRVGIGTTTPSQQLSLTGGIGFANQNAIDKKLYSPQDGTLEWFTHDAAGEHGFAVSHQGARRVYFNTNGNSYLIGGNLGIGTTNPDQKLTVKGKIHAEEVIVDLNVPVADFVFHPTYKLMPLNQVEQYVKTNNHLPEIPSASEVSKNGMNMGEMQNKLLQKVEELTLYVIELNKKNNELEKELNYIKKH